MSEKTQRNIQRFFCNQSQFRTVVRSAIRASSIAQRLAGGMCWPAGWIAGRELLQWLLLASFFKLTVQLFTPVKYILVWKVLCLFCFEICTTEGRGGEKGGSANFKTKHTEHLTQGLTSAPYSGTRLIVYNTSHINNKAIYYTVIFSTSTHCCVAPSKLIDTVHINYKS